MSNYHRRLVKLRLRRELRQHDICAKDLLAALALVAAAAAWGAVLYLIGG